MRRHGIPLCTGRGTSSYAVNEESPSPGEAARAGAAGPGPFAHRPAAVVIGTAAVTTVLPETLAEWQRVVDLTARLARVPASLIMRTERPKHTVLVTSRTEGNPYDVGREYDRNAVLYCQGVFDNDGELVVEDATGDPVWAGNGPAPASSIQPSGIHPQPGPGCARVRRCRPAPSPRVPRSRAASYLWGPCASRGAQTGGVRLPPPRSGELMPGGRPYAVPRRTRRRGDAVRGAAVPAAWGRRRAGTACACCARYSTSWSPASSSSCSLIML